MFIKLAISFSLKTRFDREFVICSQKAKNFALNVAFLLRISAVAAPCLKTSHLKAQKGLENKVD